MDYGSMDSMVKPDASRAPHTILVVDDDDATRRMLISYFQDHDLAARPAANRQELARQLATFEPSLILLDLRLGQDDGLELLREIRARSDVPVIITTGHRIEEIDRVVGLELGADDYVMKPFGLRELFARVKAVLRRRDAGRAAKPPAETQHGGYKFEGWRLDKGTRTLHSPGGESVSLTKGEYGLLLAFLEAPQRTLTREQLLQATRIHEDIYDRSIDVQVLRLRRKLESDASAPKMIRTQRGVGYVFEPTVEAY